MRDQHRGSAACVYQSVGDQGRQPTVVKADLRPTIRVGWWRNRPFIRVEQTGQGRRTAIGVETRTPNRGAGARREGATRGADTPVGTASASASGRVRKYGQGPPPSTPLSDFFPPIRGPDAHRSRVPSIRVPRPRPPRRAPSIGPNHRSLAARSRAAPRCGRPESRHRLLEIQTLVHESTPHPPLPGSWPPSPTRPWNRPGSRPPAPGPAHSRRPGRRSGHGGSPRRRREPMHRAPPGRPPRQAPARTPNLAQHGEPARSGPAGCNGASAPDRVSVAGDRNRRILGGLRAGIPVEVG